MTQLQDPPVTRHEEPEALSWATKINYGIGITGRSVANGLTGRLERYTLTVLQMNQLPVTILMIFGQAFDGISDLFMGTIIDNTRSRWGKFRPWWAAGTLTNALITMLLFSVPTALANNPTAAATVVYVAIMWLLWDLTYTLVDVSYWSMIPALAPPGKERDIVSTIPRVFSGVFGLATAFNLNIITWLGGGSFGDIDASFMFRGFRIFSIVFSCIYLVTSLYGAIKVKEPRIALPTEEKRETISLSKALGILWRNKQTLTVVVVFILFNLAANMTNSAADFFFQYVSDYSSNEFGIFNTVTAIAGGIGMFAFPILSKRMGRTRFFKLTFALPVIACAGMFLFSTFMPGVFIPFLLSMMVGHFGYGVMGVMQNVMLADTVDYGEWKTGQRNEGILFCTLTMLSKIAGLLNNGVSMSTNRVIRFGGEFYADFAAGGHVLTRFQANGIRLRMFGFSPIALLAAFIIYVSFHKLTPERMEEINLELIERRREAEQIKAEIA